MKTCSLPIVIFYTVLIVLFVGVSVDLGKVKPPSCDELFTYYHAKGGSYNEFIEQTESGFNRMPPFYFFATKAIFSEQNFIFKCRMLSLVFALLNVFFLYKIARFWHNFDASLLLSLVCLLASPYFLEYAIDARPYALCLLLLTIFIYKILDFEQRKEGGGISKFTLFLVCFLLPSSHYLYGISALFVGLAHVLMTDSSRWVIFKIYLLSGLAFIASHFSIFIEQQKFGNLLAMIDFPTFEKLGTYLLGFFSWEIAVVMALFNSILFIGRNRWSPKQMDSTICLIQIVLALFLVFLVGVLIARIFPGCIWFLPRYYLGTVLILPFLFITLFSMSRTKVGRFYNLLIIGTAILCGGLLLNRYKHKKYFYENDRLHSYRSVPPREIMTTNLPVFTKDIILFSHYIYAGKNIYYLNADEDLLTRIGKFYPSHKNYMKSEISEFPSVLLNIGTGTPNRIEGVEFTPMGSEVGPIHRAFHLRKI